MDRSRIFFLLLLTGAVVLSAWMVVPYLQYVLLAALLAYVLFPIHKRLATRVGARLSAGFLIVATFFVVLVPFLILAVVVVREALGLVRALRNGDLRLTVLESYLSDTFDVDVDLLELLRTTVETEQRSLVNSLVDLFGGLTTLAIGTTILLFVLYYLLKDGRSLVAWSYRVTPLPDHVQSELHGHIDRIVWAAVVGNLAVALVQGVLTGVGLLVVGFPSVLFWTVMTTLLSLLPLIGASVVWLPAAVYLLVVGDVAGGVFLLVYGSFVVSLSDNYLRPLIGGHQAHLNPGLFIVGIFGGVATLGFVGLFVGPIVLGVLKALLDLYETAYDDGFVGTSGE